MFESSIGWPFESVRDWKLGSSKARTIGSVEVWKFELSKFLTFCSLQDCTGISSCRPSWVPDLVITVSWYLEELSICEATDLLLFVAHYFSMLTIGTSVLSQIGYRRQKCNGTTNASRLLNVFASSVLAIVVWLCHIFSLGKLHCRAPLSRLHCRAALILDVMWTIPHISPPLRITLLRKGRTRPVIWQTLWDPSLCRFQRIYNPPTKQVPEKQGLGYAARGSICRSNAKNTTLPSSTYTTQAIKYSEL